MQVEENVVPEGVALPELKVFVEYHTDDPHTEEDVKKNYPDVLKAVMRGTLDISDNDKPVLTLKQPIKDEEGNPAYTEITFKTRIPRSQAALLSRGMDMTKDALAFANKITSYLSGLESTALLDRLGKFDLRVIDQITGLFT